MNHKNNLIALENDHMFSSVMQKEDAAVKILQTIFPEHEIDRVEYLDGFDSMDPVKEQTVQKFIQVNPAMKSIRLDLYFKNSNKVYNIEMQRSDNENIAHRARYYSSIIDANLIEQGTTYDKLLDSYVIFLCTTDPFKKGNYIYKFKSMCENEKDLCENNGRYNIYLNTKGTKGDINLDLEVLFEYINGGTSAIGKKTNNELVNLIDGYVVEFNRSDTWRKGYMTLELLMQDKYKNGLEQGLAKGLAQGKAQAEAKAKKEKASMIKDLYAKNIPLETIAECAHLSKTEVQAIITVK